MQHIAHDFFSGFLDSICIHKTLYAICTNHRLIRLMKTTMMYILIFSLAMYLLPVLSLGFTLTYNLLQILFLLDIINTLSSIYKKNEPDTSILDNISVALTMTIYVYLIYFITFLIDVILYHRFYYASIFLKTFLLCMYHSFLAFNNIWHTNGISMKRRIDHLERLWPYYIGYGLVASIIYWYQAYPSMFLLYNTYNILIIINVFYIGHKHPVKNSPYFKLNFSIFSGILHECFRFF